MTESKKKWIRKHGPWGGLLAISIASVILLGARSARSVHGGRPPTDAGLRYLCVGDVATDLWREKPRDDGERAQEIPFAEARRNCRPPQLPGIHGAEQLAATVAPNSGYGLALDNVAVGPREAISRSRAVLLDVGWVETPGSKLLRERMDRFHAASYVRDGAWLLTVAVPRTDQPGSRLLMAGQWPGLQERLK